MLKLPLAAYDWSLRHLIREGDTDLFPSPFEIRGLHYLWSSLRKQFAGMDVTSYVWRGGRRFVLPKKMLAFRVATQLDPTDSLVLGALLYKYGATLEGSRLPVSDGRVFSHRFMTSKDGMMYADSPSWHDFWNASLEKSKQLNCKFVLVADIADFYNQIYHHTIERHFSVAKIPAMVEKIFKKFLQTLTDKVSRGVPVGPHACHLLAECALDSTDRSLLSNGYDFCRYIDDVHIFASSEEAATGALYDLVAILDSQRLMLQNDKTRILTVEDFQILAESMLIDRPATDEEKDILEVIARKTGGDKYKEVSLSALSEEELQLVSRPALEDLISHYLGKTIIDYPRLSWLIRRLTQVGAPGAVPIVLANLSALSPILGPVSRYIMASMPNYTDDKNAVGEQIVHALDYSVIKKSPYLQAIMLDVLATLPELDHVDAATARYQQSDPLIRREILRVAGTGGRGDWLRDRKAEFRNMDPWMRRACINASTALPRDEADFWVQGVKDSLSPLEKVVVRFAFKDKQGKKYKLGEIDIVKA